MAVTVVNKYKEPNHIYCGRGSALGNPFAISATVSRDDACNMYVDWFNTMYFTASPDSPFFKQLDSIVAAAREGDVNLGCFCAPKRCHCETIKDYVDHFVR